MFSDAELKNTEKAEKQKGGRRELRFMILGKLQYNLMLWQAKRFQCPTAFSFSSWSEDVIVGQKGVNDMKILHISSFL
jgi:hypothetical protein